MKYNIQLIGSESNQHDLKIGKKAFITVVIGIDGTHFEWFRRFHESFFKKILNVDLQF